MICWARVRLVRLSWVWTKRSRRMPAASGGTRITVTTEPSGTASGRVTARPRPKGPLSEASSRVLIRVIGGGYGEPGRELGARGGCGGGGRGSGGGSGGGRG